MIYHCLTLHRIGDVVVSMLSSNVEDRVFEPQSGQTNNYITLVGICCLFAKHTLLRSKRKDWLTRNHDYVSEWSSTSTSEVLFQ